MLTVNLGQAGFLFFIFLLMRNVSRIGCLFHEDEEVTEYNKYTVKKVSDIPAGDENVANLFLQCTGILKCIPRQT
jgi:hypothetical protein